MPASLLAPLLMSLWATTAEAQAGRGFAGLAWRPLSRQDLVWVDESRTSGTAVGEFDGTVRPVLGAFGGAWFSRVVGLSVELQYAQIDRGSRTEDTRSLIRTAVLRPALDLRFGWMEPRERAPIPWVFVGVYGDIPIVGNRSTGFTEDEQASADEAAADTRYRLGGVGGRAGLGLDYRLLPGLMIGGQVGVGLHRAGYTGGDTRFSTLWVSTEAALLVTFEWVGRGGRPPLSVRDAAHGPSRVPPPRRPADDVDHDTEGDKGGTVEDDGGSTGVSGGSDEGHHAP